MKKPEAKKVGKKKRDVVTAKPLPTSTTASVAAKKLGFKLLSKAPVGTCIRVKHKGKPAATPRSRWCRDCKKAVRKMQLKLNNIVWRQRVKKGTAGNHVVYKGKTTKWAAKAVPLAIKKVKKGQSIVDLKGFRKALEAAKSVVKPEKKKADPVASKVKALNKEKVKTKKLKKRKVQKVSSKKASTPEPDYA